jgi:hypothetical protein
MLILALVKISLIFHISFMFFFILIPLCKNLTSFRPVKLNGRVFYKAAFSTRHYSFLTTLYYLWYPLGIKVIPECIFGLLSPVALAHWIMCDGTYNRGALDLCTGSFTIIDIVRLMNVLCIRYNFNPRLHHRYSDKYPTYQRIYIPVKDMPALTALVRPYIILSMAYK